MDLAWPPISRLMSNRADEAVSLRLWRAQEIIGMMGITNENIRVVEATEAPPADSGHSQTETEDETAGTIDATYLESEFGTEPSVRYFDYF